MAQRERAGVARDGADAEAGQLRVRDRHRVLELVGERAEPGAEHEPEARAEARRALGDDGGGRARAHASVSGPNDSGSSSASEVVRRTRSRSARWIGASAGELAQALAAAAARRALLLARRRHDDLDHAAAAARHHRPERRRLGALALRVGGVLDVGARVAAAVGGAHGGADGEVRVRRVGAAGGLAGEREELGVGRGARGPHRVRVRPLAQRVVADAERLAQLRDLRPLAREVRVRLGDRLELEERAEPSTSSRWMRTVSHSSSRRRLATTTSTPAVSSSAASSAGGSGTGTTR